MIMITVAATLTPTAIPIARSCPSADLLCDVGEGDCTCDVMVCTGVVVQVMISEDVLEVVDIFEAVCVDVNKVFVVTSAQEVADGS